MTIPISNLIAVQPSVIAAGGAALFASGLLLTTGTRVPINGTNQPTVASFPSGQAVSNYFGATSAEAKAANGGAGLGTGYFGGFTGSNKLPASMLVAQYNAGAVAAYIRGGPGLTLAQVQAINATLTIVVDGLSRSGNVNLTSAASFSAAAALIATALNASPPQGAQGTASIAAGSISFTASIAGQIMTVTATASTIVVGGAISGTGVAASSVITGQLSGAAGGVGTYSVTAQPTPVASTTITETYGTMTVTAMTSGAWAVGQTVTGGTTSAGTIVTALGTGTGQTGTYIVNNTQTVTSGTLSGVGTAVAVTYDSVSTGFVITSGIVGPSSSVAFATGAAATSLLLTAATAATLSQGAGGATPAAFMEALLVQNSNWVTFWTAFDPDSGVGNSVKQAFAAWKNQSPHNDRFLYACWDTDPTVTTTLPSSTCLGQVLAANNDNGTALVWEATDLNLAAFIAGAVASIDFTQPRGRTALAFKSQPGLVASISDPTSAANAGGNPQVANSFGNGYSFYGAYGSATSTFVQFQRGFVTGLFLWIDSYVNQVVMNYSFQNALMTFLTGIKSVPYSTAGNALIEAALGPTIQQFLSFGAFGPATLSASEIAEVNNAAGANIATTLQAQGYYLQILPASPTQRANRTSPPMTFWYIDQGSVQALNLASIELQ